MTKRSPNSKVFWVDSRILRHLVDRETLPGEGFPPVSSSHLPGGAGQRKWPAAMLPEGSPRFCLWPGQTYLCHRLYHPSGLRPAVPTRWLLGPGWLHSRRQEGEMVVRIGDGIQVGNHQHPFVFWVMLPEAKTALQGSSYGHCQGEQKAMPGVSQ